MLDFLQPEPSIAQLFGRLADETTPMLRAIDGATPSRCKISHAGDASACGSGHEPRRVPQDAGPSETRNVLNWFEEVRRLAPTP